MPQKPTSVLYSLDNIVQDRPRQEEQSAALHSSFLSLRSGEDNSSNEPETDEGNHVSSSFAQSQSDQAVIVLLKEENERLHRRVAGLEQELWQLKSSVRGDEEEKANLQKQLKQKSEVVARHFEEVARKDSKRSLFGPSAKDINSKMQEALEEALSENVEVRALNEKCNLEVSQLKKIFEQEASTVQALEVTLMTKENEIHQLLQKMESLNVQSEEKSGAMHIQSTKELKVENSSMVREKESCGIVTSTLLSECAEIGKGSAFQEPTHHAIKMSESTHIASQSGSQRSSSNGCTSTYSTVPILPLMSVKDATFGSFTAASIEPFSNDMDALQLQYEVRVLREYLAESHQRIQQLMYQLLVTQEQLAEQAIVGSALSYE